jgi:hypothetical protein
MVEFLNTASLTERYRRLVQDVISRLPDRWNVVRGQPPKRVTFTETEDLPEQPMGFAVTLFREDSPFRRTVTEHSILLFSCNLSECTDDVVRWVVAHELGHVVTSHLKRRVSEERREELADSVAVGWRFSREREAWEAWNSQISHAQCD